MLHMCWDREIKKLALKEELRRGPKCKLICLFMTFVPVACFLKDVNKTVISAIFRLTRSLYPHLFVRLLMTLDRGKHRRGKLSLIKILNCARSRTSVHFFPRCLLPSAVLPSLFGRFFVIT